MAQLLRDTSFALRMLRKRWGITLVAVASLAVAIGGNIAVFSLVSAVLLQPTSIVAPERVMLVQERLKTQSLSVRNQRKDRDGIVPQVYGPDAARKVPFNDWLARRPGETSRWRKPLRRSVAETVGPDVGAMCSQRGDG